MIDNDYFWQEMHQLLSDDEYSRFVSSTEKEMCKSLRVNTHKTTADFLKKYLPLGQQSDFDVDTYLLSSDDKLGKHPFHLAGLYYLQEPSATSAVNALDVCEDDIVLDLCAAPGGKSTQILNRLSDQGFLISNEYDKKRANIVLNNLERWGYDNYLLVNTTAENLCAQIAGCCDKVLVDAPCSGASMFKKYPESIKEYTAKNIVACHKRQLDILNQAYNALKQNGILVYSTCTYNLTENEETVKAFCLEHPDIELIDTGLHCGQAGYDEKGYTRRVFPFNGGEGHFVAKMRKKGEQKKQKLRTANFSSEKIVDKFIKENYNGNLNYTIINNRIYCSKYPLKQLNGNVYRCGILLGEIIKNRIEPAHHFFITYTDFRNIYNIIDEDMLKLYLNGQSLPISDYHGYVQIRYLNIPIGFGKADGKQIKNHLPKGLRVPLTSF